MVRLRNDPDELMKFGKKFKDLLDYHGVTQSELARQVFGLSKDIVNQMIAGNSLRLTPKNFFRCLEGLVILEKFTEEDEVKDWLEDFYTAKGMKYRPLEESPEGREILKHIKQIQERRQKELEISHEQKTSTSIPHADRAMQLAPIIGRKEDIVKILKYLLNGEKRLITLTGGAGVGKTRLALEVLKVTEKDIPEYTCAYISLAGLEPNAPILSAIARGLGIEDATDATSLCKGMQSRMKGEVFVLFLDNLEHVINLEVGDKWPNKELLTDLLRGYSKLRIIATSRTPVRIEYEQVHQVMPLPTPPEHIQNLVDLLRYSASELFIRCALTKVSQLPLSKEDAQKIATICRGLGGLPLAIRIAAAWSASLGISNFYKQFPIKEMLTLTNDDPELARHQTLLATFDWSYNLLNEKQKFFFRSLAIFACGQVFQDWVFAKDISDFSDDDFLAPPLQKVTIFSGGCALDAAVAVCKQTSADILKLTRPLIDNGLVEIAIRNDEPWFYMLPPIYEFAKDKLEHWRLD